MENSEVISGFSTNDIMGLKTNDDESLMTELKALVAILNIKTEYYLIIIIINNCHFLFCLFLIVYI